MAEQITIISDLLKRDPAYKEVIDQIEERLYNRYIIYLSDKPKFNSKTQAIPKQHLAHILSFKNTLELNKIAKKYSLLGEQRNVIPAILWKIFWRETELKNLPQLLNSELSLNNIRLAYQVAGDISALYVPISDYLGDVSAIMKKWQYEIPAEEAQGSIRQPADKVSSPKTQPLPTSAPLTTTSQQTRTEERPIFKVQDAIARLPRQNQEPMGKDQAQVQTQQAPPQTILGTPSKSTPWEAHRETMAKSAHSDLEPEYLPDEPKIPTSPQPPKPANPANIIDLKNF